MAGIWADAFIIAGGVLTTSFKLKAMWFFPMGNTIVWLHFEEIVRYSDFPIIYSYAYFGVLLVILITLNILMAKKMQFINSEK